MEQQVYESFVCYCVCVQLSGRIFSGGEAKARPVGGWLFVGVTDRIYVLRVVFSCALLL